MSDVQVQFLNQLRSATTPGSHKRQLELLYPTSISISIDVHAPKLWIPISSNAADGALYVDAGKLKMAADKPSKSSTTRWGLGECKSLWPNVVVQSCHLINYVPFGIGIRSE